VSNTDAIGTPEGAPVPEVPPAEPTLSDAASITLEDVQNDEELSLYIASADRVMDAMGYTEHGFRHANLVGSIAYQVLHRLGFTEREAQLACVAGYLHDVGNALARDAHGQTGGVLVYEALRDRVDGSDLMTIIAAIANHRSRVRKAVTLERDIHDRVNYAVEQSFLRVDSDARTVSLELTIDTTISKVMEYFEIFLGRMQMCRFAAEAIDARFRLVVNGQELA
jgi:hypothetical protein